MIEIHNKVKEKSLFVVLIVSTCDKQTSLARERICFYLL